MTIVCKSAEYKNPGEMQAAEVRSVHPSPALLPRSVILSGGKRLWLLVRFIDTKL